MPTVVPTLRELIMGLFFSQHGRPFGTAKDIPHTTRSLGPIWMRKVFSNVAVKNDLNGQFKKKRGFF
jgi:hypothetical protein